MNSYVKKSLVLMGVVAVLALSTTATADTINFQSTGSVVGTWSYNGSVLSGNITPTQAGLLSGTTINPLVGSTMFFTSGLLTSQNGTTFNFGSGGSLFVLANTSGLPSPACSQLFGGLPYCFIGSFTSSSAAVNSSTGTVLFNGSFVQGQIDSSLLAALGASHPPVWMGSSQWQLVGALSSGATSANSDRGTTASGTISVSPSSVPEPSSLALLGTGLIGAAGMLRRKLRR